MTQKEALDILKTGANVFITGPAGSGKTYVVNQYIDYLREHHVPVGITASTGIAATHMGGVTIHSWAGIGIVDSLSEYDIEAIADKVQLRRRIEETKVLIIDEVSMLHHFRLDMVDAVLRYILNKSKPGMSLDELPFGGMQVVLCGDFFQLPPVSRMGEPMPRFMYHSDAWENANFNVCYLSENYRQTDDVSLSILNEIRSGEVSDEAREHLRGRHKAVLTNGFEPTRLFTHNINVDTVNDTELAKIESPEFRYEMSSRGKKHLVEALKRSCLAPEILRLRKGARVMCVKNNFEKDYVNGTLGVVVSCGPGVDPVIRTVPNRDYPNGRTITIEQASWKIEDEGKVLAEIDQYPLRLAWAITVHKSQGMSLDAIEVDLSRSFEPGMGYVALSRVRTLAGLTILGMNEIALQVHPEVLKYDRKLRERSDEVLGIMAGEGESEIVKRQEQFLARVAPLHREGDEDFDDITGNSRAKPKKVSTYAKTAALVKREKMLREIAKERDMTVETIIAHLEELVAVDDDDQLSLEDIAYLKREISPQHFNKIKNALEEVQEDNDSSDKPPLLSPVKEKLGPNISFKDIRLARVLLGYIKEKRD